MGNNEPNKQELDSKGEIESIDLLKVVKSAKSKPIQITAGWALATLIAVAVSYNTIYLNVMKLIDSTKEVKSLSKRLDNIEKKMEAEHKKNVHIFSLLKDNETNQDSKDIKDYAVITNIDNCDSLETAITHLRKSIFDKNCK